MENKFIIINGNKLAEELSEFLSGNRNDSEDRSNEAIAAIDDLSLDDLHGDVSLVQLCLGRAWKYHLNDSIADLLHGEAEEAYLGKSVLSAADLDDSNDDGYSIVKRYKSGAKRFEEFFNKYGELYVIREFYLEGGPRAIMRFGASINNLSKLPQDDRTDLFASTEYNGFMKQGVQVKFYLSGKIEIKEEYIDGRLDGVRKEFYDGGSIKLETEYWAGLKHGREREYDPKGNLLRATIFVDDEAVREEAITDPRDDFKGDERE